MQHALYSPLDPKLQHIRVLDLAPSLSKGRLVGWFETVSLAAESKSGPNYEAVSWCWGQPTRRKDVLLNGQITTITDTAYDTLLNMCLADGHLRVWMDAVCINQRNVAERSQQVAMMGDVYSKAAQGVVWLGNGDETTDAAFDSVNQLSEDMSTEIKTRQDIFETLFDDNGAPRFSELPLPSCDWNGIIGLFESPWFSRFWVVQEVMLAQHSLCYQGQQFCSWSKLSLGAQWLRYRSYQYPQYCGHRVVGVESASRIWTLTTLGQFDFTSLLRMGTERQTSLPLDKVYGALGLWKHSQRSDLCKQLQSSLPVDYDQACDVVFAAAARAAIVERAGSENQLDILEWASTLVPPDPKVAEECSVPSWVPRLDWTYDAMRGSPVNLVEIGIGAANGLCHDSVVAYGKDSTDWTVISLSGVVVDKVVKVASVVDLTVTEDFDSLAAEVIHCRRLAMRSVSEREFALAMTAGCDSNGEPVTDFDAFTSNYYVFRAECIEAIGEQNPEVPDNDTYNGESTPCADEEASELYYIAMLQGISNRRLFTTPSGFIGTGPPSINENDLICILLGGTTPFALREDSQFWNLIGTAYVQGIMEVSNT